MFQGGKYNKNWRAPPEDQRELLDETVPHETQTIKGAPRLPRAAASLEASGTDKEAYSRQEEDSDKVSRVSYYIEDNQTGKIEKLLIDPKSKTFQELQRGTKNGVKETKDEVRQ